MARTGQTKEDSTAAETSAAVGAGFNRTANAPANTMKTTQALTSSPRAGTIRH